MSEEHADYPDAQMQPPIYAPPIQSASLQELIDYGFSEEVAKVYYFILTSPDIVMGNLTDIEIFILRQKLKLINMDVIMNAPPPYSKCICSISGVYKLTTQQIAVMNLVELWFIARTSRGRGGYEREAQKEQMGIRRLETTPMLQKPNFGTKVMSLFKGGQQR